MRATERSDASHGRVYGGRAGRPVARHVVGEVPRRSAVASVEELRRRAPAAVVEVLLGGSVDVEVRGAHIEGDDEDRTGDDRRLVEVLLVVEARHRREHGAGEAV